MTKEPTTPPDFIEQPVTPEQIMLGAARLDSHFRKWLIEQLTAMGDGQLQWKTSPQYVADFAERARQLVSAFQKFSGIALDAWSRDELTHRINLLCAEAATQGQATIIERAIAVAQARIEDVPENLDTEKDENAFQSGYLRAATSIKLALERINPDPSYLDRVRNEARIELEAEVRSLKRQNGELKTIIDMATDDDPGTALSKLHKVQHEAATAALEQAAMTICFRCQNRAAYFPAEIIDGDWQHRDRGEGAFKCEAAPVRILIAAIGDDNERTCPN